MFNFIKKSTPHKKKYLLCDAIGQRLVFFAKKVAYCSNGNPSQNMLYPVIFENFKSHKDFNINYLIKHIKNTKKNLKNGNIPLNCIGCPCIHEFELCPPFLDNKLISYVQFSDYGLCNSKCIYCNSWTNTKYENSTYITNDGKPDSYEILPIIKQLIRKKVINRDTVIDFAGGEPTLYRQFEEALKFLLDYGTKQILIFSNIIKYSEIIEQGIKDGIITLTVSIDAGSKETHKIIKGVNSYDNVYKNLIKYNSYKKYQNQIISKYVICLELNDNIQEISMWIEKSREIGINKLIINADNRIFEKEVTKEILLKLKVLGDFFINKMKTYGMDYQLYSNMQYVYQH